jgi:hypothetical protein
MISRSALAVIITIGFFSIAANSARAKSTARAHATPYHVTIASISPTSITINQPGGKATYKIVAGTEITFDGENATTDRLGVGMSVEITPDPVDDTIAGFIQADDSVTAREHPRRK